MFLFFLLRPWKKNFLYPSSSNQRPMDPNGLTRYVSAPSSFLTNIVDSVSGNNDNRFAAAGSENFLSPYLSQNGGSGGPGTLGRAYCLNQIPVGDVPTASNFTNLRNNGAANGSSAGDGSSFSPSALIRQSSSPAGFINNLMVDNGFSIINGIGGGGSHKYPQAVGTNASNGGIHGRLNTQPSFTSTQDSLYSQISDDVEDSVCNSNERNVVARRHSGSFTMSQWDDSGEIDFSNPPRKRFLNINGDIVTTINDIESQSLVQSDYVMCRLRAKRGFATQPRSIAERDRRGRISEKLNKLQELFPEMDKQTCKAEMLDFAVKYIKSLQGEVKKLNRDLEKCTCKQHDRCL